MDLFRKYLGAQQGDQLPSGAETVGMHVNTFTNCVHTLNSPHNDSGVTCDDV